MPGPRRRSGGRSRRSRNRSPLAAFAVDSQGCRGLYRERPMDTALITRQSSSMAGRVPPHLYFVTSAVFHYLGPAFAVLLFARIEVLGVAWLRIASAAVVFAVWRRPWRGLAGVGAAGGRALPARGAVLAVVDCCFFQAVARPPLGPL